MRILVVGAGGTGGYYGGRLLQAGRDVTFLVRPQRAAALRERGLEIISPHGDATLHPPLLTAPELRSTFDVVLLSVKAFGLVQAIDDFAPAVGPETMIVPVLNGMSHIDRLVERFGDTAVLGGVSQIMATVDEQGRVVQLTEMHRLAYGERAAGRADRAQRIAALDAAMSGAGFDARLSGQIDQDLWEKWVLLATMGGITCLLRGTIGDIEAVGAAGLTMQLLDECGAVANAAGHPPSAAYLAQVRPLLVAPGSTMASSMYRDLMRGLDVEVEQILGDLLLRAQRARLASPLLAAACAQLRVYQRRVSAKT